MKIFNLIVALFRQRRRSAKSVSSQRSKTVRIFPKTISSIESRLEEENLHKASFERGRGDCPHNKKEMHPRVQISQVEPLDYSTTKLLFAERIMNSSPSVRMFFKTGDGKEQTPIVTGRMISAQVMEVPNLPDVIDIVVRIPAEQAAKLPFVEVHDE